MEAIPNVVNSSVRITHKDLPVLEFGISMFGKDCVESHGIGLFHYLNSYWSSLPAQHQDKIYEQYQKFQDIIDMILSSDESTELITNVATELMALHASDDIRLWISANPGIVIPEGIPEHCIENIDRNVTHDRTIVRRDYMEIIAMSLAMHAMVPIWGEYIPRIKSESGTSRKEIYAFALLEKSKYFHCRAVEVITNYIDATVKDDKYNPNIVNQGTSSEDYPRVMMCITTVRKISVADISGREIVPNIIKLIYKSIVSRLQNLDRDYETGIKNKDDESRGNEKGGEENKLSVLERYRITYDQDIGTVVELNHSANSTDVIINKLGLDGHRALVDRCMEYSKQLVDKPVELAQLTILKWVVRDAIIPRGIPYVEDMETIARLIGIAQAKLWVEGHEYLAMLISCYQHVSSAGIVVSPMASKDHISKEIKDEITSLYPCREKTLDKRDAGKEANLCLQSVDALANSLARGVWRVVAPPELLTKVAGKEVVRLPIRPSIKTDIAKLVLDIGYRWNNPNKRNK